MSDTVVASVGAETASAPARPASSYGAQPHDASKGPLKRQIVCFSFYKVMPEWKRLPAEERAKHKAEFAAVLEKWNRPGEFLS
ncbi:MAG TPA: chlorite dismutase, partial [Edaphobacter sp.]|nr:chlorite dismutase [Edaphobacter sp.]